MKLDIPGAEYGITSDEALCLESLPKKVVVIGGGYIAVEFAGIFNGSGSETHIVFRQPAPLRGFDEDVRWLNVLCFKNHLLKLCSDCCQIKSLCPLVPITLFAPATDEL